MSGIVPTGHDRFIRAATSDNWAVALTQFMSLLGDRRWSRRVSQLIADAERSPYGAKVVTDYHWLEVELWVQSAVVAETGELLAPVTLRAVAALSFASTAVDLHGNLNAAGQRILKGRLLDGLNTGFAGLFLELDLAAMLLDADCEVGFPDFEGHASYDLDVMCSGTALAVECKSVSVDAGRKIRRTDFYRFMSAIERDLANKSRGQADIVVVTMTDRFPGHLEQQREIAQTVLEAIEGLENTVHRRASYNVYRESIDYLIADMNDREADMSKALRERFGDNCHVAGALGNNGGHLIVVRSEREDDPSRASLDARKTAVRQLPSDLPGIIALQYEDITVQDLSKPDFRRRATILDNAIFHDSRAHHVAAIYHSAFDGLWQSEGRLAKPAFVSWSNKWRDRLPDNPFVRGVSNSRFAELLGSAQYDPDDHIYGCG